jgi:GT2 family glycosyltransferase
VAQRRHARAAVGVVAHHRPLPRRTIDPRVAVVVITHNRVDEVVENLGRLARLPERPHVIVVDNASTDGTPDAIRRQHPWVETIVADHNAGAIGRNLAVGRLSQPYVAFADDDTWWDPGSLRRAADLLDLHPDVAVLTARIVVEPAGVEDPIVADMRHSPLLDTADLPGHPLLSFLAGASVVRRTAFTQLGGFEPMLRIGGEEELLSADLVAAGWHLRYIPELTVHHAASSARDRHRRRADGLRNTLWCTWLRRPLARGLWRSMALLRRVPHDRVTATAVAEALAGLPWVLRERHVLPPVVEQQFRLLDRHQLNSPARRYVS